MPVPTGTFVSLHLAVSQAKILLRVLKERFDAPARSVGANHMLGRCVDLIRDEVVDRILFVFVGLFFVDNQLHVSQIMIRITFANMD